jgi:hypothetical protein
LFGGASYLKVDLAISNELLEGVRLSATRHSVKDCDVDLGAVLVVAVAVDESVQALEVSAVDTLALGEVEGARNTGLHLTNETLGTVGVVNVFAPVEGWSKVVWVLAPLGSQKLCVTFLEGDCLGVIVSLLEAEAITGGGALALAGMKRLLKALHDLAHWSLGGRVGDKSLIVVAAMVNQNGIVGLAEREGLLGGDEARRGGLVGHKSHQHAGVQIP